MLPRERMIATIRRRPFRGRVPHFELVFHLTMEALGKVHPMHRDYGAWNQMTSEERRLHRNDIAEIYIATAARYEHDAIFVHATPWQEEEAVRILERIREMSGDRYFLMMHGDATFAIPDGSGLERFAYRIADEPEKLKAEASGRVDDAIARAERLAGLGLLDAFALCSDYCFNAGPFLSPGMFSEYITPYLARLTQAYRDMGFYVLKHTDGNIMPVLDQLVQTRPHVLHSLDPQAGVDLAEVKRRVGDQVCLMGNVNCGLLQTGTDEDVDDSARQALRAGMPGRGYIFSTSNCIFPGMPLKRYERMLDVWKREGNYDEGGDAA